jgi:hypothetical protein
LIFDPEKTYNVVVFDSTHQFADWQELNKSEIELHQIESIHIQIPEANKIRWFIKRQFLGAMSHKTMSFRE